MRFGIWFLLLMTLSGKMIAQHCPWDGTDIMVLAIKAKASDSLSISNLKLTVTDSLGHPCRYPFYDQGELVDTAEAYAFQNEIGCDWGFGETTKIRTVHCFWFARNNYVIATAFWMFRQKGMTVVIEDIDGNDQGGQFEKQTIRLDPAYAFTLCWGQSRWLLGPKGGFVDDYRPFEIILKPKSK